MGQDSLKKEVVKSGPDPLGGGQTHFLWATLGLFWPVFSCLVHFRPVYPTGLLRSTTNLASSPIETGMGRDQLGTPHSPK